MGMGSESKGGGPHPFFSYFRRVSDVDEKVLVWMLLECDIGRLGEGLCVIDVAKYAWAVGLLSGFHERGSFRKSLAERIIHKCNTDRWI